MPLGCGVVGCGGGGAEVAVVVADGLEDELVSTGAEDSGEAGEGPGSAAGLVGAFEVAQGGQADARFPGELFLGQAVLAAEFSEPGVVDDVGVEPGWPAG
jgi:hypothetical protein